MSDDDGLQELRHRFPEWVITAAWTAANSGPDVRVLHAVRGRASVSATGGPGDLADAIVKELALREQGQLRDLCMWCGNQFKVMQLCDDCLRELRRSLPLWRRWLGRLAGF